MGPQPCMAAATAPGDSSAITPPPGGWYVYGVTRGSRGREPELVLGIGLGGEEPVRALPAGELAAVVSRVSLTEFGAEELRAHVKDPIWLEAMVRGHERVVEAVQRQRPVLPAKFGCVWLHEDDLIGALARDQDALLAQLDRVQGCDEWGLRLCADRAVVERHVVDDTASVRQLRQEIATAGPGRAYFLQRKLIELVGKAADQALGDLAKASYDRIARYAAEGQANSCSDAAPGPEGETEILRAAFLVRRTDLTTFVDEIERLPDGATGLRGEYSGPWPPYSFVRLGGEGSP